MEKLLPILFIPLYVSTTHACKGVQEIILQPYMGEKVAYPENYPVEKGYGINLNCSWKISGIAGYDIVVYPKWTCEVDAFFRLYYAQTTLTKTDGCVGCPRSDGYCNEIIRTGSSEILLTLRTSSPYKEGGFQFRFMSVEKKKIDTCDSTDRTLVAESTPKFITSPGFPSEYQSELHCSWRVKPAFKKKDIRLVFEFRSQYLEKSIDGCIDYVKIESIGEFCEDSENNIFRTSGRMLLNDTTTKVQFVSDIGFGGSGFVLAFYVEDSNEFAPMKMTSGGLDDSGSYVTSSYPNATSNNLEIYRTKPKTTTTLEMTSGGLDDSGSYMNSSYPDTTNSPITAMETNPDNREQIQCQNETFSNITWNATIAGTTTKESCPENQKGTATRYCDTRGVWEMPNLINCSSEAFVNASKELDVLLENAVNNTEKIQKTVDKTLMIMKNLTSETDVLSAGDISFSLDILEKIVNVTNLTNVNIEKKAFFEVVDNVLSTSNTKSWATVQEKTEKDGSSLLKNMDRLGKVLMKNDNLTETKFSGTNFELTINRTKLDETGIIFPDISSKDKSVDEYATFLKLPKQANKSKTAITYVAVIYKTISEILDTDSDLDREQKLEKVTEDRRAKEKNILNSEILSLTTQTDLGDLFPPLSLNFQHLKNKSNKLQAFFVSWSFTLHKWSEKGCKLNSTNNKRTICHCNHLTNFAILMRPYTSEKEDKASLKTLSFVGVIVSIVFTVLTFIIFIMTWKYIKNDQNIMLLNLCGSLVLSYVAFISAVEETNDEVLCTAITAIIHYLFLVTFFCMMGMGVYYFMSITVTYYSLYMANNFKSKSRVHWFLLGGWGIPFIIASSTLGAFWGKKYHLENYCWLSMESGSLYLFVVPVCVIAMVNILIIVSLIRVLFATSTMIKSSLHKKAASGLRSLGTLVPVLGVTWIFGVMAFNERAEVFQFIFIIANSLQGFFIFFSHVVLNKKLIKGLKTQYPSLSGLSMFTESRKKEPTAVSRTQSSASDRPMVKSKKKGILSIFETSSDKQISKTKKAVKSDSLLTEKTECTDYSCVAPHEKICLMLSEKSPKETETKFE